MKHIHTVDKLPSLLEICAKFADNIDTLDNAELSSADLRRLKVQTENLRGYCEATRQIQEYEKDYAEGRYTRVIPQLETFAKPLAAPARIIEG